jgi:lysophospholipase L1-like esterase
MLGLALLIIAIASATLVDVAVVLALVALLGVTVPPDEPLPEVTDPTGVIVSLGDSYMSGEGADRYLEGTDEGGGNECRRARTAWAVLASEELDRDLVFLACSGADSWNLRYSEGRRADQEPVPEPQYLPGLTQLAEYRDRFAGKGAPALVVLSIGGNDAGFASIGLTCLAPGDCNDDQPSKLWSDGNLDRVENRLRQVYAQIRTTFRATPVVVAPYPDPLAAAAPCDSADLSTGDVVFIRKFLASLNERVRTVADDYGFYYAAPMVDALRDENLQLCGSSPAGPGINFIGIRSVGGFLEHRLNPTKWHHNSLHPNARGHAAMNASFQRWLAAQVDGPDTGLAALRPAGNRSVDTGPPPVSEVSVRDGQEAAAEGCAAYPIDDDRGCKALSTTWALQETGVFVLARGLWALFVVVGAWLIAVAFFGWRRAAARVSP